MLDSIIRLFETMDTLYPDPEYKDIIQPDEVVTWVDIDGSEQPIGPSSWANDM